MDPVVRDVAGRQAERRVAATSPTTAATTVPVDVWRRVVDDCDRLLRLIERLTAGGGGQAAHQDAHQQQPPDGPSLSALTMLREDLVLREAQITEREQRVWGWRLVATARDAEAEREHQALAEREDALSQRERQIAQRELDLIGREEALAARAATLEEEHARGARALRDEVARLRSRVMGGVGGP
jgi:uncharacterized protein (DUF3084 family)